MALEISGRTIHFVVTAVAYSDSEWIEFTNSIKVPHIEPWTLMEFVYHWSIYPMLQVCVCLLLLLDLY